MTTTTATLPWHPYLRATTVHTCERCGDPARVVLLRTADFADDPAKSNEGWVFHSFDGGYVAISVRHTSSAAAYYFWGAELSYCGFRVVVGDQLPDSLINALFRELHRWEEPTVRIEGFDLDRFLAAGFTSYARANDGSAPLLLLPNGPMLRHFLVTGLMPATNAGIRTDVPVAELAKARAKFIDLIGADARPLA